LNRPSTRPIRAGQKCKKRKMPIKMDERKKGSEAVDVSAAKLHASGGRGGEGRGHYVGKEGT